MQRFILLFAFSTLALPIKTIGQTVFSGKVIDIYTHNPISNAEVYLQGTSYKGVTDQQGIFNILTIETEPTYTIKSINDMILWTSQEQIDIKVYTLLGMETNLGRNSLIGSGIISWTNTADGVYILTITYSGYNNALKINKVASNIYFGKPDDGSIFHSYGTDTLEIIRKDYYSQKYAYQNTDANYELLKLDYDDINYLNQLFKPEAFGILEGMPFNPTFGEMKSIKVVYSIFDDIIYYVNSERFFIHYDFCKEVLGYNKGHETFNREQYTINANRIYICATLNHFAASDIFAFEFFPSDQLDCSNIENLYYKIAETSFIGNKLRFFANSPKWVNCTNVSVILADELYKGQNFQPLNPGENFGYLKKVTATELESSYLGRHDIVLLNTIPMDISVVAGIITTDFQTSLSHINVLSHNRGTPNMALRDAWTNPKLNDLLNKLVYLKVTLDSFCLREATLIEAQEFWALKEPQIIHVLDLDTTITGIIDLDLTDHSSVSLIGGKAANFAELTKIDVPNYGPLPLPEGYFAVPFYYYWQHLNKYGLHLFIDKMLKNPLFQTDFDWRQKQLTLLRDSIKKSPIDTTLLRLVKEHIAATDTYKTFRFRSSTNAEDIEGFNGAGLYDSYTGSTTDADKPIDKAIKKVWASLWNYGAFDERDYFKIDQKTIAMGILVHRSYPAEAANGVAITKNLYNIYNRAITINVQIGEISIVKPDENYLPDQIILYTFSYENIIEYINHSNVPGMEGKTVMTNEELRVLRDYSTAIHNHFIDLNPTFSPMDIEFKVDIINGIRKIYIKQARVY